MCILFKVMFDMRHKIFAAVLIALLVVASAPVVQAQSAPPPLPALCYGELTVNGEPAPVGTKVVAKVDGVVRGELVSEEVGWYGGPGLKSKLAVAGENLVGKTVRFYVSGTYKGTAYSDIFAWEERYWGSGEVMQINLGIKGVESSPSADPPAVTVPNPLPEPEGDPAQYEESFDPGSSVTSGTDSGTGTSGSQVSGSASGSTGGQTRSPSSTQRSGSGSGDTPFQGSTSFAAGNDFETAAGQDDPEGTEASGDLEGAAPGGEEAVTGIQSLGWALAVGALLSGVAITLVIGFFVRRADYRNRKKDEVESE